MVFSFTTRSAVAGRTRTGRQGRITRKNRVLGLAGVLTFLAVWEISTRTGVLSTTAVPPASEVIGAIPHILTTATFWSAMGATLASTVVGLLIGAVIAIPLGTLIGVNSAIYDSTKFVIEFLKPIPIVALLPLAILVFGVTFEMKIALITFGVVWPLIIQVIYGVRSVDAVVSATARSYRVGRWRSFLFVLMPSAAPYIATGLRIAGVVALLLSIVTELVGKAPGLGVQIYFAQSSLRYVDLYAYILLIGILGVGFNAVFELLERKATPWHVGQRKDAS